MINKVDVKDFQEHITKSKQTLNEVQWTDQYEFKIRMVEPDSKETIPPELIKSYSFKHKLFNTERVAIGTKSIKYFNEATLGGIDVVLYNHISLEDKKILDCENLIDYFLKDKHNKDIIPKDGSYLLPDEYYFYIETYQLDAKWNKKLVGKGEYLIDSELQQDFTSEGGEFQEITLSFVPKE